MSSESLKIVVIRGDTIRIQNTIRDFPAPGEAQGDLIDVESHAIKLLKPDGTQQGSDYTSPTHHSTGIYYQDITVPADGAAGEWSVEWKVTKNTLDSKERIRFKVVE